MVKRIFFITIISLCFSTLHAQLKVACVGNSITENYNLPTAEKYPTLLQNHLGSNYIVRNYGVSGRTMLKKGNYPYWNEAKYTEVLQWQPDIVIIKLGTNDAKPGNWIYKDEFEQNYTEFVNSFKNLQSNPVIYVCYPLPAFPGNGLSVNDATITDEMIPMITAVAQNTGATIIDLHTPFEGKEGLVADKIHPNFRGTTFMAYLIGNTICTECNIPELPEDFFIRTTSFDYTDKHKEFTLSVTDAENPGYLIDNSYETTVTLPFKRNMWFKFEFEEALKLTGYAITPAKNANADNPKTWRLQGATNGLTWEDIDTKTDQEFNFFETNVIETPYTSLDNLKAYKYYRLLVVENHGGENLQLGELQLFGFPATLKTDLTKNGGTITAEHAGYSGEGVENLIDGLLSKKYCIVENKTGWVQYDSPVKTAIEKYTLTSCYNLFERNPKSWELSGSNDGNRWDILDSRTNQDLMVKFNMMEYEVSNTNEYTKFRLKITENNGGNSMQFSEWQLFARDNTSTLTNTITADKVYTHNGQLYVTITIDKKVDFQLFDVTGRIIGKGLLSAGENVLNIENSRIVFIRFSTDSENSVLKLLI